MTSEIKTTNTKKKVLILSHSSEIGGAELSMIDFFEYWTKKDKSIEPIFIIKAPAEKLADVLTEKGWEHITISYSSWVMPQLINRPEDVFRNARMNTKAVRKIDKIIQRLQPDVVTTNTLIAPWAAFAAKLNAKPHVWFVREYGDIDHGHSFELGRQETFEDIDVLSDLVATCSQSLSKHVSNYVAPNKVTTLYTPFDLKKITRLSNEKIADPFSKEDAIKVIVTGVIKPSKGHSKIVEAFTILKRRGVKAELCVVGNASEPEYLATLKKTVKASGMSKNIHFVGKQANPYAYMRHADIGVMASKMEAFGRVTFEYLSLGLPVIGAATGGTLEMVHDGKNGFLFDPGKAEQIADKIEEYSKNKELLAKHQRLAKSSATDMITGEFGADALIKRIETVIKSPSEYRLPHFTKRWLNIPVAVDGISYGSGVIHIIKKAYRLGPRGTYHRARHRVGVKVNRYRKKKR